MHKYDYRSNVNTYGMPFSPGKKDWNQEGQGVPTGAYGKSMFYDLKVAEKRHFFINVWFDKKK